MKILIITMNVGGSAPGIVFEKLIHGLSTLHQIDLITAEYKPNLDLSKVENIFVNKNYYLHPRITRLLITLFNVNPLDCYWAWKVKRIVSKKTNNNYDIILSFLAYDYYAPTIAGTLLSKKFGTRLAVHSTDAIPAPVGWLPDDLFYKSLRKMMKNYLRFADAFFTTNSHMLEYQLKTFVPKKGMVSTVIYNPGLEKLQEYAKSDREENIFIYTGGLYGPRKADYLLAGFEKLLEKYPNSKLMFIGSQLSDSTIANFKPDTIKHIEVVAYTKDLVPYYKNALALIDIDGDLDNDVFISSKMPIYLMINRIIISETGPNSPSRHLFKGINSIIQCDHNGDQLCMAMEQAINRDESVHFSDRSSVVELFKGENIVNLLTESLRKISK